MRSRKQKKRTDTNSNLLESKGKQQQATATSRSNPMVQQVSRMGNAPNPGAHAAVLNRAPANQQSSNQQLLLQLQRQHGNGYVNQVLQLKRSKAKRGKGKEKIKKGTKQHGADVSDVGGGSSGLGSTITESNEAGGMSGVLGLPAAGLDTVNAGKNVINAYKAFQQNDHSKEKKAGKAAISSTKATVGLAGSGAGIAGFFDGASETATNAVGGGAGIVTGGIDAVQSGINVYKARKNYKEIRNVARGSADKLSPQGANNKPRSRKELKNVLETAKSSIDNKQTEINNKQIEINNLTPKEKPNDRDRWKEHRPERKHLKKQQKAFKKEKRDLKISSDILAVSLYTADGLKKTGKREAVNTTAGAVKAVGGGVSLAPGAGQIAGGAIGLTGAAIKPTRALVHKGKQKGRDKKLRGFNQHKTTSEKDTKREDIANKMVKHRTQEGMQKIFESLPGVTQEQVDEFSNPNSKNPVSKDDIQKLLKRRNY